MKAFLMAAGLGSRLRPITDTIPKCLVPINGVPLIDYWLKLFKTHGINEILINSHYLHDKVSDYLSQNNYGLTISLFYEKALLGSLGTLINHKKEFNDDGQILVCYSDNLTDVNLTSLIRFHDSHNLDATIGLFRCQDPTQCGIVELDINDTVVGFEEKPARPKGDLANAGIYIFNTSILSDFADDNAKSGVQDIGNDLLPKLIGRMKGYRISEFLLDIGSLENYKLANEKMRSEPIMLNGF